MTAGEATGFAIVESLRPAAGAHEKEYGGVPPLTVALSWDDSPTTISRGCASAPSPMSDTHTVAEAWRVAPVASVTVTEYVVVVSGPVSGLPIVGSSSAEVGVHA